MTAGSVNGLMQLALLVCGEHVQPRRLGTREAKQPDETRAGFLGAGVSAGSGRSQ